MDSMEEMIRSLHPESARALLVLPDRSRPDPDSHSRRICTCLRKVIGGPPFPLLLVVIVDPDAKPDFDSFEYATVLHEDSLRATLLASACMDMAAFQTIEKVIDGTELLLEAPIPEGLRDRTFGDVLARLDELSDGTPISVLGIQQSRANASQSLWMRLVRGLSPSTETGILLAPGYDFPLASASALVILAGRPVTEDELNEAALRAFPRKT